MNFIQKITPIFCLISIGFLLYSQEITEEVKIDISGREQYVSLEEFNDLKKKVNTSIIESIQPADDNIRVEVKRDKPIILRGTVITDERVILSGEVEITYEWIDYGKSTGKKPSGIITRVQEGYSLTSEATIIEIKDGYIYPGFLDMHNHIHYNFSDLWIPTYDKYPNRNTWPKDKRYVDWKKLFYFMEKDKGYLEEITKFGEIKGILGGATLMQGCKGNSKGIYCLARNVENNANFLGEDSINQLTLPINKWWSGKKAQSQREKMIEGFESGKVKRYIIHFCEGIDETIHEEFEKMRDFGLIREEFIGIHSTGLRGDDWNDIASGGMKIVWSPLSNLILYNDTTDIAGALDHGVPPAFISFAPDWSPSGTPNMLFEAKVVHEYSQKKMNGLLKPLDIFRMMTEYPSVICGYDKYIGTIQKGRRADITVLRKKSKDPYKSVLLSENPDVEMVLIDGQLIYGNPDYFRLMQKGNDFETFQMEGISKAIDITESGIPKGNQTFKELLVMLNKAMVEARNILPFEFPDDINNYCVLAPLYWPKYTSYENIMNLCITGKNTDSTLKEDKKKFRETNHWKNRVEDSAVKYKTYKREISERNKIEKEQLKNNLPLIENQKEKQESFPITQEMDSPQIKEETVKININTADIKELMTLPNIGKSKALKIIEQRESKSFDNIKDIMKVKGIGEGTFKKFKDRIITGNEK